MKVILISIKPKWVAKILNGKKTIEIRKTMPRCDLPIDVYIYCCKSKKKDYHLIEVIDTDTHKEGYEYDYYIGSKGYLDWCLDGKVVAKFTLKHIDNLSNHFTTPYLYTKETCLTWEEILNYRNNGLCYAWHISNLEIFDKPKEISEFMKTSCKGCPFENTQTCHNDIEGMLCRLTKAPQSWCYVAVN